MRRPDLHGTARASVVRGSVGSVVLFAIAVGVLAAAVLLWRTAGTRDAGPRTTRDDGRGFPRVNEIPDFVAHRVVLERDERGSDRLIAFCEWPFGSAAFVRGREGQYRVLESASRSKAVINLDGSAASMEVLRPSNRDPMLLCTLLPDSSSVVPTEIAAFDALGKRMWSWGEDSSKVHGTATLFRGGVPASIVVASESQQLVVLGLDGAELGRSSAGGRAHERVYELRGCDHLDGVFLELTGGFRVMEFSDERRSLRKLWGSSDTWGRSADDHFVDRGALIRSGSGEPAVILAGWAGRAKSPFLCRVEHPGVETWRASLRNTVEALAILELAENVAVILIRDRHGDVLACDAEGTLLATWEVPDPDVPAGDRSTYGFVAGELGGRPYLAVRTLMDTYLFELRGERARRR